MPVSMQRRCAVAKGDANLSSPKEELRRARTLVAQGFTVREAAARIKVGKTVLYTALAQTTSEPGEGLS